MLTRLMTNPSFLILFGSVLIGLGGLIATYGWDIRSSEDTRRALEQRAASDLATRRLTILRTLAAELIINKAIIEDRKFTELDDGQLSRFVVFPRLQTTAIATAIASGLFAAPTDNQLFTALFQFQELASDFNTRLETTESVTLQDPTRTLEFRKTLRDGRMLAAVRTSLQNFGSVLVANGIDPNERFFQIEMPAD